MQYVESSKKERCTLQYVQKRDDHWLYAVQMKCTEGWPMKVHSIGIYQRPGTNAIYRTISLRSKSNSTQNTIGLIWARPVHSNRTQKAKFGQDMQHRPLVAFALQRFQSWKIRKLHDGISKKYKRLRRMSRKLWSKAHSEMRNRSLLTNVLKHYKNTTRLKSQHLGCSACTIWLTQCSLDGTEILTSMFLHPWESESVFLCLDIIYDWSVLKEVDISICTWTGWELDIQYLNNEGPGDLVEDVPHFYSLVNFEPLLD